MTWWQVTLHTMSREYGEMMAVTILVEAHSSSEAHAYAEMFADEYKDTHSISVTESGAKIPERADLPRKG